MQNLNGSLGLLSPTPRGDTTTNILLDSKLISPTFYSLNLKNYDIKLVECNDFLQLYLYNSKKLKNSKPKDFELELKKYKINKMVDPNNKIDKNKSVKLSNQIELKNIIRSKLVCQRLAKANMKYWETFITLTFSENITDINFANKRFRYFIDKVRRVKPDFKYLCIPEFQKRGAIHYHLLTNIKINDPKLMYAQEDKPKYKHIKYWNEGFTSVEIMKGDTKKVVGYIAKYMTKNIDNRLFSKHRFFYSQNLKKPIENYINLDNPKEKQLFIKKIQDRELIYQNCYYNKYDNTKVLFLEFRL